MKNGKTLLVIGIVIVILLLLAWFVSSQNKKKTQSAINNQQSTTPNPEIVGRHVAVAANVVPDFTEIVNGKSVWLWSGGNVNCQTGYTKILSGPNAGWCVLSSEFNRTMPPPRSLQTGNKWCCTQIGADGKCQTWEQKPTNSPCAGNS